MNVALKKYKDAEGNTYGVERASNGMFICVRTNAGKNRKGWKNVGAQKDLGKVQSDLDSIAQRNGWKEVAQ